MKPLFAACLVACLLIPSNPCYGDFDPIAGWQEQVFPSYLIATAAMKERQSDDATVLGDRYGSFGVSVTAPSDNATIHLRFSAMVTPNQVNM